MENNINIPIEKRAEILIEALPYIQEYYNKIVVIKYGGNAMLLFLNVTTRNYYLYISVSYFYWTVLM